MALEKCPRCELNYVKPGEKYCTICMRDMKGVWDASNHLEICPICGENPVLPGMELCTRCIQDHRSLALEKPDAEEPESFLGDDTIVAMDELVPDLDDHDAPADEIEEIKRVFEDDEEEPLEELDEDDDEEL